MRMPDRCTSEKISGTDDGATVESVFSGSLKVKLNTMQPAGEIRRYRGTVSVPVRTFEFLTFD